MCRSKYTDQEILFKLCDICNNTQGLLTANIPKEKDPNKTNQISIEFKVAIEKTESNLKFIRDIMFGDI